MIFQAERLLAGLVSSSNLVGRAAILVANKSDLVRLVLSVMLHFDYFISHARSDNKFDLIRTREVKTAVGKQLAVKYNVKYIETSPGETRYSCYISCLLKTG